MDFVLDSSDSEYVDSPRALRTRPKMRRDDLPRLALAAGDATSSVKIENGRLYLSDSRKAAIIQSELQAVYDKLDTPRTSSVHTARAGGGDGIQSGGRVSEPLVPRDKSSFDASRERMKLANIIDSETNADDTTDFLFLRPITMQGPLENTPKRPAAEASRSGSALKKSYSHGFDSLEAKFSDVSDAEDLLAEFTRPSLLPTGSQRPTRSALVDEAPVSPGRLLHIDSTSEHSTPRYQNIRDELDQSRTRFRQSISALLNSSPISVRRFWVVVDGCNVPVGCGHGEEPDNDHYRSGQGRQQAQRAGNVRGGRIRAGQ